MWPSMSSALCSALLPRHYLSHLLADSRSVIATVPSVFTPQQMYRRPALYLRNRHRGRGQAAWNGAAARAGLHGQGCGARPARCVGQAARGEAHGRLQGPGEGPGGGGIRELRVAGAATERQSRQGWGAGVAAEMQGAQAYDR